MGWLGERWSYIRQGVWTRCPLEVFSSPVTLWFYEISHERIEVVWTWSPLRIHFDINLDHPFNLKATCSEAPQAQCQDVPTMMAAQNLSDFFWWLWPCSAGFVTFISNKEKFSLLKIIPGGEAVQVFACNWPLSPAPHIFPRLGLSQCKWLSKSMGCSSSSIPGGTGTAGQTLAQFSLPRTVLWEKPAGNRWQLFPSCVFYSCRWPQSLGSTEACPCGSTLPGPWEGLSCRAVYKSLFSHELFLPSWRQAIFL